MSVLDKKEPLWWQRCGTCGRKAPVVLVTRKAAPPLPVFGTHDNDRDHCLGIGVEAPESERPDARYALAVLQDDHTPNGVLVAQMLALFFDIDRAGQVRARPVSVGPPAWAGVDGNNADTPGKAWGSRQSLSVNEVRKGRLTKHSVYTLTGNEPGYLKYTGELGIDNTRWMVMVPSSFNLEWAEHFAKLTMGGAKGKVMPDIIRMEATLRHHNRHPNCNCDWAKP